MGKHGGVRGWKRLGPRYCVRRKPYTHMRWSRLYWSSSRSRRRQREPRGQNIANCDTCEHNDRQRGDTMSLFRWLEPERACLLIRTDVLFYVSLVTLHGVSFLPICVHPPTRAGDEPMLLGYVWQTDGRARELLIKYSLIDSPAWRSVGLLDVVVCGIRDGKVRVSVRE